MGRHEDTTRGAGHDHAAVPDDAPDARADHDVDEIEADLTDGADPTVTARRGVGMAPEVGNDQDPASYLNT